MNLLKLFMYGGVLEVFVVPHILPYITSCVPTHVTDMIQLTVAIISGLFPHVMVNMQSEVFLKVWNDADEPAIADIHAQRTSNAVEATNTEDHLCERHKDHRAADGDEYRSRIASKLYPDDCDPRVPNSCETTKRVPCAAKCGQSANQMIYSMAMRQMSRAHEPRVTDYAIFGSQHHRQNVAFEAARDGPAARRRGRPLEESLRTEKRRDGVGHQVIGCGSDVEPDFARSYSRGRVTKFKKDVDDKCPINGATDVRAAAQQSESVDLIDDAAQRRAAANTQSGRPSCEWKWKLGEVKENKVSFRNPSSPRKTSKNENDTADDAAAAAVYFGSNFRNL